MIIIYKTTNKINNKIYVGRDCKNNPYYFGSGIILKKSIKKYGKENFKKEILCKCKNINEAIKKEKYWIKKLNSFYPNGYNISAGGDGGDVLSHNPNKLKIIEKKKGHIPWNKGKKMSDVTKKKIRKSKLKFFKEHPEKKINSGCFKSGKKHILYGKKREKSIIEKIKNSRMKSDGYKSSTFKYAIKSNMKKVCVENIITGKKIIYNSVKDAYTKMNIPRVSFTNILRKKYKTNKSYKYKDYKFYYYKGKK